MNPKNVGEFIAELRSEQNITQKDLAERLGVTDKAVSRWETGKGYPDIEILQNISTVFGVTVNELLCGERIAPQELIIACDNNVTKAWYKNKKLRRFLQASLCTVLLLCIAFASLAIYSHKEISDSKFMNTETYLYSTSAQGILSECSGIINSQINDFEIKNFSVTMSSDLQISTCLFDGISRERNTLIKGEAFNRSLTHRPFNCTVKEEDIPKDMSYLFDSNYNLNLNDINSVMALIDFKSFGPQNCEIVFSLIPEINDFENYKGDADLPYQEFVLSDGQLVSLENKTLTGNFVKFDLSRMLKDTEENEITVNGEKRTVVTEGLRSNTYAVIYVSV